MEILKKNAEKALMIAEKKLARAVDIYKENKNNIPQKLGKKFQKLLDACLDFLREVRTILNGGKKIYE